MKTAVFGGRLFLVMCLKSAFSAPRSWIVEDGSSASRLSEPANEMSLAPMSVPLLLSYWEQSPASSFQDKPSLSFSGYIIPIFSLPDDYRRKVCLAKVPRPWSWMSPG
jgi:hypothetical protein